MHEISIYFPRRPCSKCSPCTGGPPAPAQALPLSEIVTELEHRFDIAWIDEIEWDDDGYWEVELYARDGSKIDLKIDPVTGALREEAIKR